MITVLLIGGAALVLITTVLAEVQSTKWWVRVCDFPRLQIMAGAATLLCFILASSTPEVLKWVLAVTVMGSLAWQGFRIVNYTALAPTQSRKSQRSDSGAVVRFLVSNVLMSNRNSRALLRHIGEHQPDLVLLLEPDLWWEEQLREIEKDYPFTIRRPQDNTYGMLLYSRLRLSSVEVNCVLLPDVPSFFSEVELRDGRRFHLHCLHPKPPQVAEDTTHRDAELVLVGRRVRATPAPCVVAGDLNDVAWSYTTTLFQKITGMLDPRRGRGFYNTYHARLPFARWPLDHLFHSRSFRFVSLERLPSIGSDHFPILAALSYEPDGADEQHPPALEPDDREIAQEKVREASRE